MIPKLSDNIYSAASAAADQRSHVEKQDHYAWADDSGHGLRDTLNAWSARLNWNMLNVVKYAFRCHRKEGKDGALADLRKILDYAMNEIERLEGGNG